MVQTKEEMFLAEMGISPKTIIEGDYTAKYKLKDLLKKYAEQCNIADVVGISEQLSDSLQDQIKRGELDPYSPHAKWIKP